MRCKRRLEPLPVDGCFSWHNQDCWVSLQLLKDVHLYIEMYMNRSCKSILHVYKLKQQTLQKSSFDKLLRLIYLFILWKGSQLLSLWGSAQLSRRGVSLAFHQPPTFLCVPNQRQEGGRGWCRQVRLIMLCLTFSSPYMAKGVQTLVEMCGWKSFTVVLWLRIVVQDCYIILLFSSNDCLDGTCSSLPLVFCRPGTSWIWLLWDQAVEFKG